MSVPVLHMSAISKRFPGVVALDGVDFETANVGGNRTLGNGALRKAPPADVTVPANELLARNAAAATRPTMLTIAPSQPLKRSPRRGAVKS